MKNIIIAILTVMVSAAFTVILSGGGEAQSSEIKEEDRKKKKKKKKRKKHLPDKVFPVKIFCSQKPKDYEYVHCSFMVKNKGHWMRVIVGSKGLYMRNRKWKHYRDYENQ